MKYILTSFFIIFLGYFGILTPIKDVVISIVSPVQYGLRQLGINIKSASKFFLKAGGVHQENIMLLTEINDLRAQLVALKSTQEENLLLKSQLELTAKFKNEIISIPAELLGNPRLLNVGNAFINKGSKDDVKVGDLVVSGNYAVGVIKNVEYSRSTVELITSPNLVITAYDIDSPDKAHGLISGQYTDVLSFERLLPSEKVEPGDTIITSGKDGVFLPGFIIGKVSGIQAESSQPLKRATVKPFADILKISKVFVIRIQQ